MAITEKQLKFVKYYSIHGKGAAAAREAGYSEKGARQAAHKILRRPEVKAMLEELKTNRSGPAAAVIARYDQESSWIAAILNLQRIVRISMAEEPIKRRVAVKNKVTGLMEVVEEEAIIFHGPTAFRALKQLLAENDRLDNPRRRHIGDCRKTVKTVKTLEDALSLELERARRRLRGD